MKIDSVFNKGETVWYCTNDETGRFEQVEIVAVHLSLHKNHQSTIWYTVQWGDGMYEYNVEENDLISQQSEYQYFDYEH